MLNFDAVIFDMDGVITKTAVAHSLAWKKMFDEYLHRREKICREPFREFTHAHDYLSFVDGRPRYKGVETFLKSRGINIPFGEPDDEPNKETVCGLGNRKNEFFNKVIEEEGVEVYDSTIKLIRELLEKGVKVGVATSSKNCVLILEKAGITSSVRNARGWCCFRRTGITWQTRTRYFHDRQRQPWRGASRAVVVEDAVSGVQAGARGNFGLVIGVARENNSHELKINGADFVVEDLSEINAEELDRLFSAKQKTRPIAAN